MLFDKKNDTNAQPSDRLYRATREIAAYFTEKELKYSTRRVDNMSILEAGMRGTNVNVVKILFISTDEKSDVAIRSFQLVPSVPQEKRAPIMETINTLNSKYRYIKFILDDDNITASFDIPSSSEEVGKIAFEIFLRFVKIIDDSYPEFMKTLWS